VSIPLDGRHAESRTPCPGMPWRVLSHGPRDGAWNMALDEAIARAVGAGQVPATVRFYGWGAPTVSLGCLQATPGVIAPAVCHERGIRVVRRPTGGRAVLHDDELTYSVCVPLDGFWNRASVAESFCLIGAGLVAGLRRMGLSATLGQKNDGFSTDARAEACFQMRHMPAVLVGGRKLVGSAQRRWDGVLLQHGSLLLGIDLEMHQAVFPTWPRNDSKGGVTSLKALLPSVPPRSDMERALLDGWADTLGVTPYPGDLTAAEGDAAERLAREQYANLSWTWRR
jgi:lipoyl(octanoyl) transferase